MPGTQLDHLAEIYVSGCDQNWGEGELNRVSHLKVFAASIGLAKISVAAILRDKVMVLEIGGYEQEPEVFEPLQKP